MISIVVPCYNCEKTFSRCIESLRHQTEENLEIVLVDDGSKDRTYELCEKVAEEDSRIVVIHQENKGLMGAWKRGVTEATGEYIAFCDQDDWIDSDLIEVLERCIENFHSDIVLYGMKVEYENNTVEYVDNRLAEGFYSKMDIAKRILPNFFSDGEMQSEIMIMARWTKLFRRKMLMDNLDLLNEKISLGEDNLTTFAMVLVADSLYCFKGYYPYHYIRNSQSMIGKYDELMFQEFLSLRKQLNELADSFQYSYQEQIEANFLSYVLLCMKKEICRNRNMRYQRIRRRLRAIRNNPEVDQAIKQCSIRKYELKGRVFAYLVIRRWYLGLYILTKMMDRLGYGKE